MSKLEEIDWEIISRLVDEQLLHTLVDLENKPTDYVASVDRLWPRIVHPVVKLGVFYENGVAYTNGLLLKEPTGERWYSLLSITHIAKIS